MASHLHAPAFRVALRRTVTAQDALRTTPAASPAVAHLWWESLQTFSAHGGWVLLCAFLGLSSPFLVGCWIATQVVLQDMAWVGPVPTLQEKLSPAVMVILACASWVTSSFARGVITGLAIEGNAGAAFSKTRRCFPALLAGNLVYSAVVSVCLLSLSLTLISIDTPWDASLNLMMRLTPEQRINATPNQLLQLTGGMLKSDADGAPFTMLLPEARTALLWVSPATSYENWLIANYGHVPAPRSIVEQLRALQSGALRYIAAFCMVLLIVTETFLRFRTVTAFKLSESLQTSQMKSGGQRLWEFAALLPLIKSAQFGWKHFIAITFHGWVLQIASFAFVLLMVELPIVAVWQFAMPALISVTGKTPLLPLMYFAQISLATLVAGIVLAFSTIYDARLFKALSARRG